MKTILEVLQLSTRFLMDHKVEHARRVSEQLLAHVVGMKRIDLYLQYDRPLIPQEIDRMRSFVQRASHHEPVEYIMGLVEFMHCSLTITPDVLIPRPETELLADLVIRELSKEPLQGKVLWDLCTGSGCLGLALKKRYPELTVILSDISPQALVVARANATTNGLDVMLREGDLLEPFRGERADFVVANPPYVSDQEYEEIDPSVRNFEPKLALCAGKEGLDFFERLAKELPDYLNPGARIFLEMGATQGPLLRDLFSSSLGRNLQIIQDLSSRDRFLMGIIPSAGTDGGLDTK